MQRRASLNTRLMRKGRRGRRSGNGSNKLVCQTGGLSVATREGRRAKQAAQTPLVSPGPVPVTNSCQRKVEMSGFLPDRNVRFHGLLQGCPAGTWYWGLILFGSFGLWSASPGGRRPEGLADRSAFGQGSRGK